MGDGSTTRGVRVRLVRAAGVLLGAALAVFLLIGARPTSDFASLPARASVAVGLTGELAVTPAPPRPVLGTRAIVPGAAPVGAQALVRNQTGRTLAVGFRAVAAARDLDGLLRVRLSAGGRPLADTTLQGLRNGGTTPLRLRAGAAATVRIQLWIPAEITDGFQGRGVAITLAPVVRAEA